MGFLIPPDRSIQHVENRENNVLPLKSEIDLFLEETLRLCSVWLHLSARRSDILHHCAIFITHDALLGWPLPAQSVLAADNHTTNVASSDVA